MHLSQELQQLDISLKEFMNRRGTSYLQLKEIRLILYQVATALSFLQNSISLTPESIKLVDHVHEPAKVELMDLSSTTKPNCGSRIESRWYKAPEVFLGLPWNNTTDVWSLVTLLWML